MQNTRVNLPTMKTLIAAGACLLVPLLVSAQGVPVMLSIEPEQTREGYQRPTTNRYQRHERAVYLELGMDRTPYTCASIAGKLHFTDVEHIVALAEAHDSGLEPERMLAFSGDPLNLTVAMPWENRVAKSDKDAADYLPPRNRCWFIDKVIKVKEKWGLSVDLREYFALTAALINCSQSQISQPVCEG